MNDIIFAFIAFLGFCVPLIGTALIPGSRQRQAAALFALLGTGILIGLRGPIGTGPFTLGIAAGMIASTLKLITGSRWL